MGSLLSYSGISAKIRAMQSRLVTEEQLQEILQLSSVPQVIAYLKKSSEYSDRWAAIPLDPMSSSTGRSVCASRMGRAWRMSACRR